MSSKTKSRRELNGWRLGSFATLASDPAAPGRTRPKREDDHGQQSEKAHPPESSKLRANPWNAMSRAYGAGTGELSSH